MFSVSRSHGKKYINNYIYVNVKKKYVNISLHNLSVMVQFYPWFNFYFPLYYTHDHALSLN